MDAIATYIGDVKFTGVSGMDPDELLIGRPYGACAICVKSSVKCKSVPILSKNKRMCACILHLSAVAQVLIINVYLPCDGVNQKSFDDVLDDTKRIVSM
jgi:hypothetical protein